MEILITRFPLESANGGAENQTMWLTQGLLERGHKVSFLGSCPVLTERMKKIGVPVHSLDVGAPPVSLWHALTFFFRKYSVQKKLITAFNALPVRPDAVLMLSLTEKILLSDAVMSAGTKVMWVEHDRIGPWLLNNPSLPQLKKLSKKVTTVCVSTLSRYLYVALGFDSKNTISIPNGVPMPTKHEIRNTKSEKESSLLKVGCICRLSPEKGVEVLLQAIAEIPEVTLSIIGKGRDEGYIRTLIDQDSERMGGQRITLASHVDDLDEFYNSLDVFVLPSSEHDPFGLVAAEAMVRGIPVVMTEACGIATEMEPNFEFLNAKPGSVESLKQSIIKILDPALRAKVAQNQEAQAKKLFSLETMVKRYEGIL